MFKTKPSPYRLGKSRGVMRWAYKFYKKNHTALSPQDTTTLENDLQNLDQALLSNNREEANRYAHKIEDFVTPRYKKTIFDYTTELLVAVVLALLIATVVRQTWFEPYEIPTGSMRPTFEEKDHLTVTKTAFGINTPLATSHLYFDPDLVQRTGVVIFSADGLPMRDTESTYFGIFPYKKRLIKRLIAKPGDTVYFYGGQVYSIDKDGSPIEELLTAPWLENLEYIPFMNFEGDFATSPNQIFFKQMNIPLARLTGTPKGDVIGEIFNGQTWIKDNPTANSTTEITTYGDLWGIKNYAMARLLTKDQVLKYSNAPNNLPDAPLYLELRHNPNLTNPKPILRQDSISLAPQISIIPLEQRHLDAIMNNMYTARFVVENERARRYSVNDEHASPSNPKFPKTPNGTYEFYFGKLTQIGWGGIPSTPSSDLTITKTDPANVQKLFNLGIDFNIAFDPHTKEQKLFPHRYAYFRNGDLYLLGAPILKKDDPTLTNFLANESNKKTPFVDNGPPSVEAIRTFGLKIPEKQYLVLGDNHAMSGDSRVFGFVPEDNLQGAPSLIIWPPSDRLGHPKQKPYPTITTPRLIVWLTALTILALYLLFHYYRSKQPIFKKLS